MFECVKADAKRYLDIDGRDHQSLLGRVLVLFFAYGLQATIVYRFGRMINHCCAHTKFGFFCWLLEIIYWPLFLLAKTLFGINLSRNAEIGKGFYVGHFGGIKVANCTIGENCNVHQLTKVGEGCIIGSNVWIGGHAIIESGVILEDFSTITAAARVDNTVTSYCLVSGNPARTIKINFDNSEMLGLSSIPEESR